MRSIFASRIASVQSMAGHMQSVALRAMAAAATPALDPSSVALCRHSHGFSGQRSHFASRRSSGNVTFQRQIAPNCWPLRQPMMQFYSMNGPANEKRDGSSAIAGEPLTDKPKVGVIAQFKDLYKRYWYVLVPVHVVTSTGWMVGFYYMSQSGVDVPELLRSIDVSDSIVSRFEQSQMGHWAIAYLCYKIATPVRYAVTVGGTTLSIKYLSQWGYIKPMPSHDQLRAIYADQKAKVKAGYAEMQNKVADARNNATPSAGAPDKKK